MAELVLLRPCHHVSTQIISAFFWKPSRLQVLWGLAYYIIYNAGWDGLQINLGMGSVSAGAKGVLARCP